MNIQNAIFICCIYSFVFHNIGGSKSGLIPDRRDAMPRVFSTTGIYFKFTPFHLVLNQDLQDFQDYRERLRFGGKGYL